MNVQTEVKSDVLSKAWIVTPSVPLLPASVPVYRQPCGKVSILQEKLNALLKLAVKEFAPSSSLPIMSCVVLTADDSALIAEVWGADGPVRVGHIGAKVERGFRCAVYLDTLSDLVNLLPEERIDIVYDPNSEGGTRNRHNYTFPFELRCGNSTSHVVAFPDEDCWAVAERTRLELTKEQKTELDWLKKAAASKTDDSRPALRYAHVADGTMVCGDGYRFHLSTLHTDGLPEWIDLHKIGQPEVGRTFPDILPFLSAKGETIAVNTERWKAKVWNGKKYANKTFENSLLACVKSVGRDKDTEIELTTDEQTGELLVSGREIETIYAHKDALGNDIPEQIIVHKSTERRIAYAGTAFVHSRRYNAKYLTDALSGMKGAVVWVTVTGDEVKNWIIITDRAGHTAVVVAK